MRTAAAHDPGNYWAAEWRSQDRGTSNQYYEFTQQVPGDSNGSFADRTADGAKKWNAIAINGADMRFVRNGVVSNYDPYDSCGNIPHYKNGIHYRAAPDGFIAWATVCFTQVTPGTDLINSFQVVYDPAPSWYKGVDYAGIGSSQQDVEGTGAHEFGHVVGGWTDQTPEGHYDATTNPGLCGSSVPQSDRHTMCVSTGPGLDASLRRSLETHDIDVFVTAYA